jgi:hypothetical protein
MNCKGKIIELATVLKTEIKNELIDVEMEGSVKFIHKNWQHFLHIPYSPALSRPGWLLRLFLKTKSSFMYNLQNIIFLLRYILGLVDIIGPGCTVHFNYLLFQSLYMDLSAGITIAMTLIPQVGSKFQHHVTSDNSVHEVVFKKNLL